LTEPETFGPIIRRKLLGRELARLRKHAGYDQGEVAKFLGLTSASVSRMENGKQTIMPRSVRAMCQMFGVGAPDADMYVRQAEESNDRAWYAMYSDTVPSWVESFLGLEAEASEVWTFEPVLIPGLLQTPRYAREVAAAAQPDAGVEELERTVQLRLMRQQRLDGDSPPRLRAVIWEAAIKAKVGGLTGRREQMLHLIELSERDGITIQVVPFDHGAHIGMAGGFTMLRFPDELAMNAVFLEHDNGATLAERPADLDRYGGMFEKLTADALTPEATRGLLGTYASRRD